MKDILTAWHNINKVKASGTEVRHIIWNNSNIRKGDSLFYLKEWHEKEIKYLDHLFDYRTNEFYSFEQFKYIYNLGNNEFLNFYQIITSRKKSNEIYYNLIMKKGD